MTKKTLYKNPDININKAKDKAVTVAENNNNVAKLAETILYSPDSEKQMVKARFWTRFEPGPLVNSDRISVEHAQHVTGIAKLKQWWLEPGFKDWFLNKDSEREKIRFLFNKSLDAMAELLDNPEANHAAKVNIFKTLAEVTGHLNRKMVEKFSDEQINKMSKEQLESYLTARGVKITTERVIDTNPDNGEVKN